MKINLLPPKSARISFVIGALTFAALPALATPEVMSQTQGPAITVTGLPSTLRVSNGDSFVFRAQASDTDGVQRVEIYANGARVSVCQSDVCEYNRVYWTNRLPIRTVELYARAVDKKGYVSQSAAVSLNVVETGTASAPVVSTSGITWNVETVPTDNQLKTGTIETWSVIANEASGISKIDVWVNGKIAKTCTTNNCTVELKAADYPAPMEIFVNADITAKNGLEAWTAGTRVQRLDSTTAAAAPIKTISAALRTDAKNDTVAHGSIVTATSNVMDSLEGLSRIDMYLNGELKRSCSFGSVVSAVECTLSIDTNSIVDGSRLTFSSRGVDNNGNDIWTNEKAIQIGTASTGSLPTTGDSVAYVNGRADRDSAKLGETISFIASGWSPSGSERITIFANGVKAMDCPSTICTAKVQETGVPIEFTARLIDNQLNEIWIQPQTVAFAK